MTLEQAPKAAAAFEAYNARLLADIAILLGKMPGVSDADLKSLVDKLGSPEKVDAFVAAMPDQPTIAEMITAFGGAGKLGSFTQDVLGGNVSALAALADKGCKRDPAKLADIATKFAAAPGKLEGILSDGGFASHPEALAQVFAQGCEGDPDKLLKFCETFDSDDKREKLRDVLDEGGLGQSPAALGSLAQGDDGALLLKVAEEADKTALSEMLLSGGMGGTPPDHPDTLKSVLTDALGNDPKRLRELHDAFPSNDGDMPEMRDFMQALNGKSATGDAMAGERIDALMKAFKRRDAGLTDAQQAQKLYDPYFKQIDKNATDSRASDESGARTIDAAGSVITDRAAPPPGRMAGSIGQALGEDGAAEMLLHLTPDEAARKMLADSLELMTAAGAEAKALSEDTEDRAENEEASAATDLAIKTARDLTEALNKKLNGGTPAEVDALTKAAEACLLTAQNEPGATRRGQAAATAQAAIAAAKLAVARQAEQTLMGLKSADAQQAALAVVGDMATRIDADPDASDAEKQAMKSTIAAARDALAATALAGQATDTKALAAKVKADCAVALGKAEDSTEVTGELAAGKAAAEAATASAVSLTKALKAAPPPVEPSFLAQAGAAAKLAVSTGLATADEPAMQAALAAAKALSDEVARCSRDLAATVETSMAYAAPEARDAVLALNDINMLQATLERDLAEATGPAVATLKAEIKAQTKASEEASRSALASAELARVGALDDAALKDAAEAEARRRAAAENTTFDLASDAGNKDAQVKAAAAKAAADDLNGKTAPIDTGLIKAATKAAEEAAAAALGAADKTDRDLALSEGKRASAEATKALAANALYQLNQRKTQKTNDAEASTNAARADVDSFTGPPLGGNRAAVKTAMDSALADIGEAAASQLAEASSADAAVQAARAKAAKAAAQAARAGASQLKKLLAIKADAEAQAALAGFAVTQATATVGAIPLIPPPAWPPVGPPAPPPYTQAATPNPPDEDQLRLATIRCEGAITAATKWLAVATQFKDAAKEYLRLAAATPDPKRSTEEKSDYAQIETIANIADDTAGAPKMVKDANLALLAMGTQTDALTEKTQKFMHAVQIARITFNPPGNSLEIADTGKDAADTDLENAAGFAAVIGTRAFKTVGLPDGTTPTMPPSSRDSLLTTGANLEKQALPADFDNPTPPPDTLPMGDAVPISGHPNCVLNLEHMCDRHCRTHFTFDPGELMAEEDVMMGAMMEGRTTGLNRDPAKKAASDFYSSDENKVKKLGSGKTTTMWPEGITANHIAAAATLALVEIKKDKPAATATFQDFVYPKPKHQHSRIIDNIAVGPLTLKVALGVSATAAGGAGTIKVVMFYPIAQESLTVADCHKLKSALGT